MIAALLVDTSGLLTLLQVKDPRHQKARDLFDAAGTKIVHCYILAELVALAQVRGLRRREVLAFLDSMIEQPDVEVIWVDPSLHIEAMRLLAGRLDKTYSLADAVSFVLMRRHEIVEALTTDHHFEQEGFVRLLHSE